MLNGIGDLPDVSSTLAISPGAVPVAGGTLMALSGTANLSVVSANAVVLVCGGSVIAAVAAPVFTAAILNTVGSGSLLTKYRPASCRV